MLDQKTAEAVKQGARIISIAEFANYRFKDCEGTLKDACLPFHMNEEVVDVKNGKPVGTIGKFLYAPDFSEINGIILATLKGGKRD